MYLGHPSLSFSLEGGTEHSCVGWNILEERGFPSTEETCEKSDGDLGEVFIVHAG
jgi:hypothetical protein